MISSVILSVLLLKKIKGRSCTNISVNKLSELGGNLPLVTHAQG